MLDTPFLAMLMGQYKKFYKVSFDHEIESPYRLQKKNHDTIWYCIANLPRYSNFVCYLYISCTTVHFIPFEQKTAHLTACLNENEDYKRVSPISKKKAEQSHKGRRRVGTVHPKKRQGFLLNCIKCKCISKKTIETQGTIFP